MSATQHNSNGVELGPHGYVVCTVCGKEVSDISRETSRAYAQCLSHRRDYSHKERDNTMPRVPKPSEAKKQKKEKAHKKPKASKKAPRTKKEGTATKGAYAELTALAKEQDGLTPDEIRAECAKRGLSKKTGGNYVCYLKRDGLVKKEAKEKEAA